MSKHRKSWLPKQFLWRLSITNTIVITAFIVLSGWSIYHAACSLADGMGSMNAQKQGQFEAVLFQYLWIFSAAAIVTGSLTHFYITRKLTEPLKKLIDSTKRMKSGHYPKPIEVKSKDETAQLIGHFNDMVYQLKMNEEHRQKAISDLSHEFRTPLSNLNGYLNALSSGVIDGDEKLYRSLYDESQRLTDMVKQLEQLKEWDYISNQTFSEKEPVDMHMAVMQSVEMFHWTLENADISVDVHSEYGVVNVDGGGILQVIGNLLDNAVSYYQGTGPIFVKGEKLDNIYRVSVAGPGQAIPAEELDRIFERFYRTDTSRSYYSGGTGLGLAISKEIVEHHGGKIGAESDGNFHTFWFALPLWSQT
ncbi:cell wall metabolism sensor histidine kinase WalK [Lentibacillus sp. CBA3610]|uniref:sensor histidine kinase n=1 Tax=Lentibacillus sp. CBA3610 TaxID=2518176 RepID=UPI0020D1FC55|nr:HAMP domain-containing sensor histidine kinase [Lentibacillus sp. CBA3610]